ncbi:MAG TPA: CARDB domain-containing protein [Bacteroidales bacterium]|nr:CARDB domain-containing protein [Bacteroidales bacterium]
MIFTALFSVAQTTVQIGTDTSTQNNPFNIYYGYGRSASIYLNPEINTSGQIISLEWYVSIAQAAIAPIRIYLKSTPLATFPAADTWANRISGATLVYDNAESFSTVGWKSFTLTTPFDFTSGNLMVLCEANYGGSGISPFPEYQYTATPDNKHHYLQADGAEPTGTGVINTLRPNIKISFASTNYTQDAGVYQILTPGGIILSGINSPVTINIKNFATDTLKKATIAWKLDGVLQTPSYSWNGVILQDEISTAFTIGNMNVAPGPHTIKVWTEMPNDSTDQNNFNDTLTASFHACTSVLSGVYTIGPSGADFPTFASALAAMQNCGISGPVTFNVQSGTYTERLSVPEIAGTSATNTITFQSLTGINTDVTLRFPTDATYNYVVKLDGADHFRFKNMTLLSTATTAYTRVIEMTGNAVDNQFVGNHISGPVVTALTTNTALVFSASDLDSLSVFDQNTFTNGSYGMCLYGIGSASLENKTTITNNIFNNQYSYAMRLYYQNGLTVSGNIINGHAANTGYYGIYVGNCDNDLKISENKIFIPSGNYGIYLYYCDGTANKKGLIANNFVQVGGTAAAYGIYATYSAFQEFYYNSVNITSTNTTSRAFHITTGCTPIVLKNNIFSNNGGGYAIYSIMTSGVASDYNDLFTTGATLGYWGGARSDLAAWQAATLLDANSVSVDPNFVNATNLHTFSAILNGSAAAIAGITHDIDGELRDTSTPDIGADEFTPLAVDLGIMGVIAPTQLSCALGSAENITIRIKNFGVSTITSADIYYKLNNGTPVHEVFNGSIAADSAVNFTFSATVDLSAMASYTFEFYVVLAGDPNPLNDSILNYTVANGWDFYNSEYNMGFELTEDVSNWSVYNADLGTYKWVMPYSSSTYSHTGNYSAQFYNGAANTGEDWLFSRCFYLQAGKTYSLSFWYRAYSASYPQTITLKYGNAATSAAMTTTLTTLTGIANIVYQRSTSQFVAPASGTYYFGWSGAVGSQYYAFVDDINVKIIPDQDAAVVSLISPINGCGLTDENVTIKIANNGLQVVSGNLTAHYKIVGGNTTVTESVIQPIPSGDTINFTFTTPANLAVTAGDSTFVIRAWVDLAGDPIHVNDSISGNILSLQTPAPPVVISDTVAYGGIATLQANAAGMLYWYTDPTGGTPVGSGPTFTTPDLFVTTPYYVEATTGSIADSLSTIFSGGNGCDGGNMFDLEPVSTNLIITGFSISPYDAGVLPVRVYYKSGTYQGFEQTAANWTLLGTYNLISPGAGIQTYLDVTDFTIPAGQVTGIYLNFNATYTTLSAPATYYDQALQLTCGAGLCALFGGVNSLRAFNGKVFYKTEGCTSARVPDTAYVQLMPYEVSVVSMPSPVDDCSQATENVTIRIRNNGFNTINGGLTAKYTVNGSAPVIEAVANTILPGDTLTHTFAIPLITGLTPTNQDSVYNIKSYIELAGDNFYVNDTINETLKLKFTPPAPVVSNITVPYASSGILAGISADSIYWYDVAVGGTELASGPAFTTPSLFGTTVYWAEARSGGVSDTTVMPAQISTFSGNARGYWFTAPVDFTITGLKVPIAGSTQNIAVVRFTGAVPPPVFNSTTNAFTTLFLTQGNTNSGFIPCSVQVAAGDVIGLLGTRGGNDDQPYAPAATTTIDGNIVSLSRMGMQYPLSTNLPQDLWTEAGNISRIEFVYSAVNDSGCPSLRVPDTVFVTGVPACDVSVQAIHTPHSGIELSNSEWVTIRVKNYGTGPAVHVPVHYVINGGNPVNDTIPGTIASNDTVLFTFATPADFSAFTTYNITVYTDLSCDFTLINDTVHKTVVCDSLVYCNAVASYPDDEDIFIVMVNDATNAYNCTTVAPGPGSILNRYSNFMTLPPLTAIGQGQTINFTIEEDECDGAWYWSNGCAIWIDYNHDGDFTDPGENVYVENTTTEGPRIITGTFTVPAGGYSGITGMRIIVAENNSGASLQPCMTYGYGETEDYRILILPQIPHDAGVTAFVQPTALLNEGVLSSVQVIVKNFGADTITAASNISVAYSYNGGATQSIIWTGGDIPPLASETVALPDLTVLANTHSLCVWTVFNGDSNSFNDTSCMALTGTPQFDAGVTAFVQPAASLVQGANANVQITLKNFGADTLTSLDLVYTLNGVVQATQPWTGTLLPNATTTVAFNQAFTVPAASFSICAYSSLMSDANHANDSSCQSCYGIYTSALPYYNDFDGANIDWAAGTASVGTAWELGVPNYGTTNSSHSVPNAWDVNLTTAYTNDATTYLYTQNFDFSTVVNATMKFWLNYDLEANYDGLRIEYTTTAGATWNVLGVLNDANAVNWYNDDVINSNGPGWTGNSSGWKQCEYQLSAFNNVPVVQFRFVFFSDVSNCYSGASIDDFAITIPSQQDAGVEVIHAPVVQAAAGSLSTVKIRIRNFGSDTLNSMPVSYRIGLTGSPVTQIWTGTLNPQDTASVIFTIPFNIPVGVFELFSYTGLSGDGDHFNDTTVNHITGLITYNVPYSNDFEGPVTWVSPGTLWEWGVPSALVIDSAYSPANAWVTNLDGDYSYDAIEYLYSPLFMFNGIDSAYLEFYHWYETETNWDGCAVEYSVGGGAWTLLGGQADANGINWYNSTTTGTSMPCWSGSSEGYVYSRYSLTAIAAIINSVLPVQFRFVFTSDDSFVYEGWAIDNFAVTCPQIPDDAGVTAILLPDNSTQAGSQVTVQVTIKNYGTNNLTSIPVGYQVSGGTVTAGTWSGTLAAGATTNYTFTTTYISPDSAYELCAFTMLAGDNYTFNDSTCASFNVTAAIHDVGVVSVVSPIDTTVYQDADTVSVYIKNYGTSPETTIPLTFMVNAVQAGAGVWSGTLNAGDSVLYTFPVLNVSPQGDYQLCARTMLSGDSDTANDEECKYLFGSPVGIETYDYTYFVLYQNVPNPAGNHTNIVFYVPESDNVYYEMVDVLGKTIIAEDIDAVRGENRIGYNMATIPEGVYFYSVTYRGQKQTKRMVVTK